MRTTPDSTHPLQRLGRLPLSSALRGLEPAPAGSGLVVTATVAVPDAPVSRPEPWQVAWADAAREAVRLGADPDTAKALERGAGTVAAGRTRVVVAAYGQVVLAWWLPSGARASQLRVGPVPHLLEVADAAARRPAYVVLLAAGAASRQAPADRPRAGQRRPAQCRVHRRPGGRGGGQRGHAHRPGRG